MPMRERARITPMVLIAALALVGLGSCLAASVSLAAEGAPDVKTFVTRWYVHGMPYEEARAFGSPAVPALLAMLRDRGMEQHWDKIVYMLGCIGDPAATAPLLDFLKAQQGEISVQAFRATLGVLPALGHLARGGDGPAFKAIGDFTQADQWQAAGLAFSYGRYHGDALGEVLGRTAIQGLGIAGTREALGVLNLLGDSPTLRPDWRDNVDEAVSLNVRVSREGAESVFGGAVQQ